MYLFLCTITFIILTCAKGIASNDVKCDAGSLECDSGGECVTTAKWCDKQDDCQDESDEAYCDKIKWFSGKDPNECTETHFLCKDGICVPKHAQCNGFLDCSDGSDELQCDKPVSSTEKETIASENSDSNGESSSSSEEENWDDDFDYTFTPEIKTEPLSHKTSAQTPPSVQFYQPSTIRDFYETRRKEAEIPATAEPFSVATQTSTRLPVTPYRRFTTSPAPEVRPASPSVRVRHPNTHSRGTNRHPSHSMNSQRPPTPRHYYGPTYVYNPRSSSDDRRTRVFDARSPAYNVRQSAYDHRSPNIYTHNYNNLTYDNRRGNYGNNPSIFPYRSQQRPGHYPFSSYENQPQRVYNGERDWMEVVTTRPYNRETQVNKLFYFSKDYAQLYGRNNAQNIRDAENWLLRQRHESGDWGKNTARALISLALANNSFPSENSDYELMKRTFIIQLNVELLRNDTKKFSVNRMASAMNALLAVCEEPRDFNGMDLLELLRSRMREEIQRNAYLNPFVYLSLCLSGKNLTSTEIHHLMRHMQPGGVLEERTKDTQSMAIQAFSCYMQQQLGKEDVAFRMSLEETLRKAVSSLLQRMADDGSFGSVYSTALAAQALMSVNDSSDWEAENTLAFLKQNQQEDGSFGNLLATHYVLPVISGRSLMHLRNIRCQKPAVTRDLTASEIMEYVGPKQFVHYSIYIGYPLENSYSVRLLVPQGITFFDVMRVADYQDKDFRFVYEEKEKNLYVYSLSGLPNDSEQGFLWHLYVKQESDTKQQLLNTRELYTRDLREFLPSADQHIIFWYHAIAIQN